MIVKLLTEHHFEFLSLKGGCRGSSESTLVKCQMLEISCRGSIDFISSHLFLSLTSMISLPYYKYCYDRGKRENKEIIISKRNYHL